MTDHSEVQIYLDSWERYADFKGRSTREQYWIFLLGNFVISIVIFMLGLSISFLDYGITGIISTILFGLATIIPTLSVAVRRFHDVNKSGWMMLINLIPGIGALVQLYYMVQPSDSGNNQYGPEI